MLIKVSNLLQIYPWQLQSWENLLATYRAGRMEGGYLFKGPKESGKLLFALSFSTWLLCRKPGEEVACGSCKSCSLVQAGSHPDLLLIEPESNSQVIKVEQVRKIQKFTRTTSQYGGMRIVIIAQAELMNINAANALLKNLEEPGTETLLFLLSSHPSAISQTVQSRCRSLLFHMPEKRQALEWLTDKVDSDCDVETILALSAGNPLLGLKMYKSGVMKTYQSLIEGAQALYKGKLTPVALAKEWEKKDVQQVLLWLAIWLEDVMRLMLGAEEKNIYNKNVISVLRYIAGKAVKRQVMSVYDWLLLQRYRINMGANLNKQLLLESAFCKYLDLIF